MKKNKFNPKMTRRQILKAGMIGGAGLVLTPGGFIRRLAHADTAAPGLSDPEMQPKFVNLVPDALSPGFIYQPDKKGRYKINIGTAIQQTGLVDSWGILLDTPVWGYGDQKDQLITWPGRTFQVYSGNSETKVRWKNKLNKVKQHLLPVDTNLHWCYSLPGYEKFTIEKKGVPIITHLHGGHTDWQFDGNPEFFYSPKGVVGPQWDNVPGGFTNTFSYDNDVPAGNLWYHDHALGITRLNVYAGMAGFYFVRDELDTGLAGNYLGLPAWPYEKAYAIQDRMFLATGELFYPAYPGDPFYDDFIETHLPPEYFPDNPRDEPGFIGGGPTALAEFFGDHMVVNGKIWPKENVEARNYRLHILNGTDSRFMAIRFRVVRPGATDLNFAGRPKLFRVIGSDQGLASEATETRMLLSEPGSRYDIIFDFSTVPFGSRVIMENILGDAPFGGDIPADSGDFFPNRQTDRIMAFDVILDPHQATEDAGLEDQDDDFEDDEFDTVYSGVPGTYDRRRLVALFEGMDEFGRLQPLLGTAEPATDYLGSPINWPDNEIYTSVGLTGQMEGSIAWHSPTTENPEEGDTELWAIWNATGDAHPVHLHLVHFEILGRLEIKWDSATDEREDRVLDPDGIDTPAPNNDGTYLVTQPVVQHNSVAGDESTYGHGFRIVNNTTAGARLPQPDGYVENAPKDMVTALPDQVTFIKATFDKPGRYVWHCHILSHEDHEMMRVLHVGPGADNGHVA